MRVKERRVHFLPSSKKTVDLAIYLSAMSSWPSQRPRMLEVQTISEKNCWRSSKLPLIRLTLGSISGLWSFYLLALQCFLQFPHRSRCYEPMLPDSFAMIDSWLMINQKMARHSMKTSSPSLNSTRTKNTLKHYIMAECLISDSHCQSYS